MKILLLSVLVLFFSSCDLLRKTEEKVFGKEPSQSRIVTHAFFGVSDNNLSSAEFWNFDYTAEDFLLLEATLSYVNNKIYWNMNSIIFNPNNILRMSIKNKNGVFVDLCAPCKWTKTSSDFIYKTDFNEENGNFDWESDGVIEKISVDEWNLLFEKGEYQITIEYAVKNAKRKIEKKGMTVEGRKRYDDEKYIEKYFKKEKHNIEDYRKYFIENVTPAQPSAGAQTNSATHKETLDISGLKL